MVSSNTDKLSFSKHLELLGSMNLIEFTIKMDALAKSQQKDE